MVWRDVSQEENRPEINSLVEKLRLLGNMNLGRKVATNAIFTSGTEVAGCISVVQEIHTQCTGRSRSAPRAVTEQFNAMYVDDTNGLVWFLQSGGSTGPVSKVIGTMLPALEHLRSMACQWNVEASALRLLIQAQIKANTDEMSHVKLEMQQRH
jgi:hypothetical protein